MYEILFIAVCFLVGFWLGELYTILKCLDIYRTLTGKEFDPEALGKQRISEILDEQKLVQYETESINNIIYLYTSDKNQFICQAHSIEDLCKTFVERTNKNKLEFIHNNEPYYYNGSTIEKIKNEN